MLITLACAMWLIWSMFERRDQDCQRRLRTSEWRFFRLYFYAATELSVPRNKRKPLPSMDELSAPAKPDEVQRWGASGMRVE